MEGQEGYQEKGLPEGGFIKRRILSQERDGKEEYHQGRSRNLSREEYYQEGNWKGWRGISKERYYQERSERKVRELSKEGRVRGNCRGVMEVEFIKRRVGKGRGI
ncbi:MAG: hypothetical protein QW578_08210 [Thermoplasmatales archaeon]